MNLLDSDAARSGEQNKKWHAMVRDISKQVIWAGQKWGEEDWKRILLGAKFEQAVVPSPFGHGFIVVNKKRSSHLTLEQFVELIGETEAFGVENGVEWTDDE